MTATTSVAAFHSVSGTGGLASSMRDEIARIIEGAGVDGLIMDDIFDKFPPVYKQYSTISGRFSELENLSIIFRAGDTRAGKSGRQQKVMRHIKFATAVPMLPPKPPKKTGFMAGLMFATRIILKEPDLVSAKRALKTELLKAAGR